jgi:hypothetical protein
MASPENVWWIDEGSAEWQREFSAASTLRPISDKASSRTQDCGTETNGKISQDGLSALKNCYTHQHW